MLSPYKKEVILTFQNFMSDNGYLFKYKQYLQRQFGTECWIRILPATPPTEWIELISVVEDEPLWSDLPEGHITWVGIHQAWVEHFELLDALHRELNHNG